MSIKAQREILSMATRGFIPEREPSGAPVGDQAAHDDASTVTWYRVRRDSGQRNFNPAMLQFSITLRSEQCQSNSQNSNPPLYESNAPIFNLTNSASAAVSGSLRGTLVTGPSWPISVQNVSGTRRLAKTSSRGIHIFIAGLAGHEKYSL